MGKARPTEEALRTILAIREAPEKYDLKRDLGLFLHHKSNHVIAGAASVAERLEATVLAQELVDTFADLMKDASKRDPGCKALTAIAKALAAMDQDAVQVYFAGIRHIQMEGSFGPPVDAAAELRGICAQGLARMGHPDALEECVTLLVDREPAARAGAVRAIAAAGTNAGVLLLRLKALMGDSNSEVTAECFAALLKLAPAPSLVFVAGFLRARTSEVAEAAAFALGESRLTGAFPLLKEAWNAIAHPERKRAILLAIAMLRADEAVDFLLERVSQDGVRSAGDALTALGLYSRDADVAARVKAAVEQRAIPALSEQFQREFQNR